MKLSSRRARRFTTRLLSVKQNTAYENITTGLYTAGGFRYTKKGAAKKEMEIPHPPNNRRTSI